MSHVVSSYVLPCIPSSRIDSAAIRGLAMSSTAVYLRDELKARLSCQLSVRCESYMLPRRVMLVCARLLVPTGVIRRIVIFPPR